MTPFQVRSYELDGLGHVNHAVYLNYLEQARFETLDASGFPMREVERRGWAVHVVRIEVDYRRECRFEDRLIVRTGVEEVRKSSMILRQDILRLPAELPSPLMGDRTIAAPRKDEGVAGRWDDEAILAVEARIVGVWIGTDRRPMRIPDEIRAALAPG